MQPKLLHNKELDNYVEQDHFDFITKADAIKYFLEYNSSVLEKNKMLVLYGEWGSGKTSLMNHIKNTIDKKIFKPIFFHAWEHEKDENLALSLCDLLIEQLDDKKSEIVKKFMRGALVTLKSFTNATTFKSSHLLEKFGLEFEFSGEKFNEEFDKAFRDSEEPSFYSNNREFKESFVKIEESILTKFDCQKILIFVDDLDRCEPENVLNLITALKLFFTFGKQTVYFCGMDKDAVTKAVKTKYKDVIKAEEYMEKVFDITFSMPRTFSLRKFISSNFANSSIEYVNIFENFFKSINFTNPRHLKKVLNKYFILHSFASLQMRSQMSKLIPDLITPDNPYGNILDSVCCLFMIILYEFDLDHFKDIEDYEGKLKVYAEKLSHSSSNFGTKYHEITEVMSIFDVHTSKIEDIIGDNADLNGFVRFVMFFAHSKPTRLKLLYQSSIDKDFKENFTDVSISTSFCLFLVNNMSLFIANKSPYVLWNFFPMARYFL